MAPGVLHETALQLQSTHAGLRTSAFMPSMIPTSRIVENTDLSYPNLHLSLIQSAKGYIWWLILSSLRCSALFKEARNLVWSDFFFNLVKKKDLCNCFSFVWNLQFCSASAVKIRRRKANQWKCSCFWENRKGVIILSKTWFSFCWHNFTLK